MSKTRGKLLTGSLTLKENMSDFEKSCLKHMSESFDGH